MPSVDEDILNGAENEDSVIEEILRAETARKKKAEAAQAPVIDIPPAAQAPAPQQAPARPAPKVEVVQPNRKLLVVFPAENRADIKVAAYEDVAGGGRKVLEAWRTPTDYERKHLVSANKEILAGADGGAMDVSPGQENLIWKYGKWVAVAGVVLGGGYMAAKHYGLIGEED